MSTGISGFIFNIQRYSINDGPGIRTCIFMKGCPLNCVWCHNPESKSGRPQLSFASRQCILCGKCVSACPRGCHHIEEGAHIVDFSRCVCCGCCVEVCSGALTHIGREVTADATVAEACRDRPFYEESGGGVTFSGGEPFAQPAFLLAMLREAKEKGLHVCIETCGFVRRELLAQAMEYVDLFLYDCKETDRERHKRYTGVYNDLILENLSFLSDNHKAIVLRCPIVPGCNDRDEHLEAVAALANRHRSIIRIDVEPYHPLGKSKAESIGARYLLQNLGLTDGALTREWIARIQSYTDCEVRKG